MLVLVRPWLLSLIAQRRVRERDIEGKKKNRQKKKIASYEIGVGGRSLAPSEEANWRETFIL